MKFNNYSLNLGIIIISIRSQTCDNFYENSTNTLHIPKNKVCFLIGNPPFQEVILESIIIDGILSMTHEFKVHIKFKKLEFGPYGVLEIG